MGALLPNKTDENPNRWNSEIGECVLNIERESKGVMEELYTKFCL